MCVTDIVEFVEEYISGETYVNCGEFYYDEIAEVKDFSTNLANAFYEKFKKNCTVLETREKNVIVKIHNNKYECFLEETGINDGDFLGYSWSVVPKDDEY